MTAAVELPLPAAGSPPADETPVQRTSGWACGIDGDADDGHDRCRDIIPELIIELL